MAAKAPKKRRSHPGLAEFARLEGCNYSHLRRVVVLRERPSPLLKKFRDWQKQRGAGLKTQIASSPYIVNMPSGMRHGPAGQPSSNTPNP